MEHTDSWEKCLSFLKVVEWADLSPDFTFCGFYVLPILPHYLSSSAKQKYYCNVKRKEDIIHDKLVIFFCKLL